MPGEDLRETMVRAIPWETEACAVTGCAIRCMHQPAYAELFFSRLFRCLCYSSGISEGFQPVQGAMKQTIWPPERREYAVLAATLCAKRKTPSDIEIQVSVTDAGEYEAP